ncbi:OmpA family protein [Acidovorax sp.]|uniref:OmpA family protein n=1 Tax=Acidovorax sp. TaxID=1872122 RepID=UPI0025BD6242|nr:OmpA family protein [Acidovorax sp.]
MEVLTMFEMPKLRCRMVLPILVGAVMLVSACAPTIPRSYVVLVPDLDGAVGQVIVSGQKGSQVLNRAGQVAGIDGNEVKAELAGAKLEADFSEAKAAQPAPPEHFMLYFISGGTRLTDDSETQFTELVARWRSRGSQAIVEVVVIGHTDTVGTAENNLALSAQRAKAVADRLQASGLKLSALTMESHGEKNPLIPTKDGITEPRNRRVQVTIR